MRKSKKENKGMPIIMMGSLFSIIGTIIRPERIMDAYL